MGRLGAFMALRKDVAFDYEREVRAIGELLKGVKSIGGREQLLLLEPYDGYVAGGHARMMLMHRLQTTLRELLLEYAHNLCLEGMELGLPPSMFEEALRAENVVADFRDPQAAAGAFPHAAGAAPQAQPYAPPQAQMQAFGHAPGHATPTATGHPHGHGAPGYGQAKGPNLVVAASA